MEEERAGGRGLAILLALAALFAASLGARASLLSSNASGYWQQAVRQEIKVIPLRPPAGSTPPR